MPSGSWCAVAHNGKAPEWRCKNLLIAVICAWSVSNARSREKASSRRLTVHVWLVPRLLYHRLILTAHNGAAPATDIGFLGSLKSSLPVSSMKTGKVADTRQSVLSVIGPRRRQMWKAGAGAACSGPIVKHPFR